MTENAPPALAASSGDSSRGMPYYEKLRRDLRETLQKKRALDAQVMTLEDNIYRLETQYLEETTAGNIIKGFDNYIKGSAGASTTGGGAGTSTRRKGGITDADRLFSKSSANYQKDSAETSANSTPSHAATPASSFHQSNHPTPSATSNKGSLGGGNKKKKAPDDDDTDSKSNKRGKITYARE